jgi:hypothetical protein
MNADAVLAFADHGKISADAARDYLSHCDAVVALPGGAIVLKADVVHIVARQHGLSGRALVAAVREALLKFHAVQPTLKCPIRHENTRAMRFAEFFGFRPYHPTSTHQWLFRHRGDPL